MDDSTPHGSLRVTAPAKVNLSLEVLGRRPDGFHEIRSVMQAVSLCDEMTLSARADGRVTLSCAPEGLPTDERNLVVRAARLMQQRYGVASGVAISLQKRIPIGGGLGGGSSDCAVALLALGHLWSLGLRLGELTEIAAELGSDVPFFLHGGTALCEGRGERVTPLACARQMDYVLVMPSWPVSTGEVYRAAGGLTGRVGRSENVIRALQEGDVELLGASLTNDLQEPALSMHPDLRAICSGLDGLKAPANAKGIVLSGSGSSFLVVVRSRREASRAADYLVSRVGVPCVPVHSLRGWDGRVSLLTIGR